MHLRGRKRIMPYRFEAQERALKGGMRGVAFAPLLGLSESGTMRSPCALHAYYINRAYPHAEISFSCPRLRPAAGAVTPKGPHVTERQLLQVICAYRIFMPFAGVTVSFARARGFPRPCGHDHGDQGVCRRVHGHRRAYASGRGR